MSKKVRQFLKFSGMFESFVVDSIIHLFPREDFCDCANKETHDLKNVFLHFS